MLRTVFLGCALPALFASAITDFGAENAVVENAQLPLRHDARLVCHGISRSISPASQVFYPGAVLLSFAELLLTSTTYVPRVSPICGRHLSLGQLELTDIHVFCAAWHSRGPRLDR
jgi:hypothetical protein